jgi:acetyl esterase/lipase
MSPWTDLTSSGASYRDNADVDPSMTVFRLQRFATVYTASKADPLCSPLFGDLSGLPESLLFVGGDEIMRDDAAVLHEKLLSAGCKSTLTIAPEMWHAYVLYGFKERQGDMDAICDFIRGIVK